MSERTLFTHPPSVARDAKGNVILRVWDQRPMRFTPPQARFLAQMLRTAAGKPQP